MQPDRGLCFTSHPGIKKRPYTKAMEWPPELILTRLRQLGQLKLQPRELLAALRELSLQYKAYLSVTQ